ncbi:MAG: TonB family protein, partial [Longimicrobiales bacterium]
ARGPRWRRAAGFALVAGTLLVAAVCAEPPVTEPVPQATRAPQPVDTAPTAAPGTDVSAAPTFTPFTQRPELRNRVQVEQALEQYYPPLLREAGIGGTINVWFFIDEQGRVGRTLLVDSASVPHEALAQAALRVAETMRFSPAMNRGRPAPVWVQLPIVFRSGTEQQPLESRQGAETLPRAAELPDSVAPSGIGKALQEGTLVYVDGVKVIEGARIERLRDTGEIARIEVIKGAAAASLYGPEAAKGVISITTKAAVAAGNVKPLPLEGRRRVDVRPTPRETEPLASGPTFTPFTERPELTNRAEVEQALEQHYPPLLSDAGIGGRVAVWFHISETGEVLGTEVAESSGHEALDAAALRVANVMRFTPALNRNRPVAVWVQLPIMFRTAKRP